MKCLNYVIEVGVIVVVLQRIRKIWLSLYDSNDLETYHMTYVLGECACHLTGTFPSEMYPEFPKRSITLGTSL